MAYTGRYEPLGIAAFFFAFGFLMSVYFCGLAHARETPTCCDPIKPMKALD